MKCPKCGKEMRTTSNITLSPTVKVSPDYWSCIDRKILFMRHAESLDFKEIANLFNLGSEDAARMRHKRAVNRLIRKIGGFKPFPDYDLPDKEEEEPEVVSEVEPTPED